MVSFLKRNLVPKRKRCVVEIDGSVHSVPIIPMSEAQKVLILRDTGKAILSRVDGHVLGTEKEKIGVGIVSLKDDKIEVKRVMPRMKLPKRYVKMVQKAPKHADILTGVVKIKRKQINPDDDIFLVPADDQ